MGREVDPKHRPSTAICESKEELCELGPATSDDGGGTYVAVFCSYDGDKTLNTIVIMINPKMSIRIPIGVQGKGAARITNIPAIGVAKTKQTKIMRIFLCTYRINSRIGFLETWLVKDQRNSLLSKSATR
jgi:hypothetical protein